MRVVVIGHPGAGKTAFLAGAYAALRRIAPLGLRARPRDHLRLRRAERRLARGRALAPTVRGHAYRFWLRPEGGRAVRVSWHDHPGGALTGDGAAGAAPALLADVLAAGAVIALVDAADLTRGAAYAESRVRPLAVLVRRRLLAPAAGPFALLVALAGAAAPGDLPVPFHALWSVAARTGTPAVAVRLGEGGVNRPQDCLLWCLAAAAPLPARVAPALTGLAWDREHRTTEDEPWTGFGPSS
ncbi:hypothetical protein Skr01_59310 [Sphaerisporangium krabiense]|uniref:Uncharacterized protein n=1 Tax=Sphaerisporangium krabiense TaxID=763782 RepID=A0A7W8ZBI9_9ACTN|nr:hypothetical protein [Sphaerisporangium krabiense]MBB5630964.1 hypothetical protein [Sphaerisporangium krabiense]GII65846.1 hypothetical protein Skr01_59310 [Sphaerisporangium krabiense]